MHKGRSAAKQTVRTGNKCRCAGTIWMFTVEINIMMLQWIWEMTIFCLEGHVLQCLYPAIIAHTEWRWPWPQNILQVALGKQGTDGRICEQYRVVRWADKHDSVYSINANPHQACSSAKCYSLVWHQLPRFSGTISLRQHKITGEHYQNFLTQQSQEWKPRKRVQSSCNRTGLSHVTTMSEHF